MPRIASRAQSRAILLLDYLSEQIGQSSVQSSQSCFLDVWLACNGIFWEFVRLNTK
ncbi:hypothetical protein BaRGS_00011093, partial [Batillaria attramentaria]